jgi:DNA-binding transcriptional ArsR family regulator
MIKNFRKFVTMKIQNPELFRLHANFCKVLANPTRLMIIALLSKSELNVSQLAEFTETSLATTSQHLRVLREHDVVTGRKEGQTVYYNVTDERLMDACTRIRTILLDNMKARGLVAHELEPTGIVD